MSAAHYVRAGRWHLCLHCKAAFIGEHFCGAEWQCPVIGDGIDDLPPSFARTARSVIRPILRDERPDGDMGSAR